MKPYYISSILISMALHFFVVLKISMDSESIVSPEIGSSKSSLRLNLSRSERPVKKEVSSNKEKIKSATKQKDQRAEEIIMQSDSGAKTSIAVENKFVPDYPYKSRLFGEEGVAIIKVTIDQKAGVKDSVVIKSSGYERLDLAALEASKKSSFNIVRSEGERVLTHTLEFSFKLER